MCCCVARIASALQSATCLSHNVTMEVDAPEMVPVEATAVGTESVIEAELVASCPDTDANEAAEIQVLDTTDGPSTSTAMKADAAVMEPVSVTAYGTGSIEADLMASCCDAEANSPSAATVKVGFRTFDSAEQCLLYFKTVMHKATKNTDLNEVRPGSSRAIETGSG
jgi:hypothetical protein